MQHRRRVGRRLLFGLQPRRADADQAVDAATPALTTRVAAARRRRERREGRQAAGATRCCGSRCWTATCSLADGQSVVWASRLLRQPLPERVAGIDLFESLLGLARPSRAVGSTCSARSPRCSTLRRAQSRQRLARARGRRQPRRLLRRSEAARSPPTSPPPAPTCSSSGMTTPKKEIFLGTLRRPPRRAGHARRRRLLRRPRGRHPPGPGRWQRLGLEWAYRLLQEPRRLWRRYLATNTGPSCSAWLLAVEPAIRPDAPGAYQRVDTSIPTQREERTMDEVFSGRVAVIGLGYIGLPTAVALATRGIEVVGVDVNAAHRRGGSPRRGAVRRARPRRRRSAARSRWAASTASTETPAGRRLHHRRAHAVRRTTTRPTSPTCARPSSRSRRSCAAARSWSSSRPRPRAPRSRSAAGSPSCAPTCGCRTRPRASPDVLRRALPRAGAARPDHDRDGHQRPGRRRRHPALRRAGGRASTGSSAQGQILLTDAASAEMAKLVENAYRDVNIAFANELSLISEELRARRLGGHQAGQPPSRASTSSPPARASAATASPSTPGSSSGAAPELARLIRTAREVNDHKPHHVAEQVVAKTRALPQPDGRLPRPGLQGQRRRPAREPGASTSSRASRRRAPRPRPPRRRAVHRRAAAARSRPAETCGSQTAAEAIDDADIVVLLVDHDHFRSLQPVPAGRQGRLRHPGRVAIAHPTRALSCTSCRCTSGYRSQRSAQSPGRCSRSAASRRWVRLWGTTRPSYRRSRSERWRICCSRT